MFFGSTQIITILEKDDLLPAIVFRSSRRQCDLDVSEFDSCPELKLPLNKKLRLKESVVAICQKFNLPLDVLKGYCQFKHLLDYGIASHHAGQFSYWRIMIEKLMADGLLRAIFATSTVAAGVDFPARTVVVTSAKKKGHFGVNFLTPTEFHQMAGRAGRRGKDKVGFCLFLDERSNNIRILEKLSRSPVEDLRSSYYPSPSTILPLLRYRDLGAVYEVVDKSFAAYCERFSRFGSSKSRILLKSRSKSRSFENVEINTNQNSEDLKENENLELRIRLTIILEKLEQLGYVREGTLTRKGEVGAQLNSGFVIEIVEILESSVTNAINSPLSLIEIFGHFSIDSDRRFVPGRLTIPKKVSREIKRIVGNVNSHFNLLRPYETFFDESAASTVARWATSRSWMDFNNLLSKHGVAVGDVSRLILQCADIMTQLEKLKEIMPDVAFFASEAKTLLLKHPFVETI
ncbi:MAG: helicase-related protein [Deltaproteobacteria bacterium]|nr:helicase-related protein [Deltaproteobacteria bacterium]